MVDAGCPRRARVCACGRYAPGVFRAGAAAWMGLRADLANDCSARGFCVTDCAIACPGGLRAVLSQDGVRLAALWLAGSRGTGPFGLADSVEVSQLPRHDPLSPPATEPQTDATH